MSAENPQQDQYQGPSLKQSSNQSLAVFSPIDFCDQNLEQDLAGLRPNETNSAKQPLSELGIAPLENYFIDRQGASRTLNLRSLIVDFSELFSEERIRRDFLVEPWLPNGSQIALYSEPKVGKSLLALELAVVLATGRAGLGMDAREPISVLYLDYENTEVDLLDRLESMGFNEADDLAKLYYFQLANIPPFDTKEGGKWIRAAVDEFQPELVVIDTMARAVEGEENSADTYRNYYRNVGLLLKSKKITLLRLDHAGKDALRGQRGSSEKAGDVDGVYRLSAKDNRITLTLTHQRIRWIASEVKFTKLDEPLRHVPDTQPFSQEGLALAKKLDELGIPLEATRQQIKEALTKQGIKGKRSSTVSEAQKIRRERKNSGNSPSGTAVGGVGDNE